MFTHANESNHDVDKWRERFLLNNPTYGQSLLELCDTSPVEVELDVHYNYVSVSNLVFVSDTLYRISDNEIDLFNRFNDLKLPNSKPYSDITINEYPSLARTLSKDLSYVEYQGYEQLNAFRLDPHHCLLVNEEDEMVMNVVSRSIAYSIITGFTFAKRDIVINDRSYHILVDITPVVANDEMSVVPNRAGTDPNVKPLIPNLERGWSFTTDSSPMVTSFENVVYIVKGSKIIDFLPLKTSQIDIGERRFITTYISLSDKELSSQAEVVAALSIRSNPQFEPTGVDTGYISRRQYLTVQVMTLVLLILIIIIKTNKYE